MSEILTRKIDGELIENVKITETRDEYFVKSEICISMKDGETIIFEKENDR